MIQLNSEIQKNSLLEKNLGSAQSVSIKKYIIDHFLRPLIVIRKWLISRNCCYGQLLFLLILLVYIFQIGNLFHLETLMPSFHISHFERSISVWVLLIFANMPILFRLSHFHTKYLSFTLPLSLSLSHTHTHIHTFSFSLSLILSVSVLSQKNLDSTFFHDFMEVSFTPLLEIWAGCS